MPVLVRPVSKLARFGKFKHRRDDWVYGDADKSLTFTVTAKHIAAGDPRLVLTCPAALAIQDVLGRRYDIAVNRGVVKVFDIKKKICMRFATSARLRKAADQFDRELTPNFEPGEEYELLPVPGWLRLGPKKPRKPVDEDAPKVTRAPKSAPMRWIVGHEHVELLKHNPFFSPHIRPQDR